MREYGSIQTKFWTHADVQLLSDQAKLLGAYLLSSPHTNMLGCFRIPVGYIADDLKWNTEIVTKALDDLSQIGFLIYDNKNSWVTIASFLKHHPIENPNQGKSIAKIYNKIPKNTLFISQLANKLLEQKEHLGKEFINALETLVKPFLNQEQEQEQEQEQKQDLSMSGKPDVDSPNDTNDEQSKINSTESLKSQAHKILQFLNEKTGRAYRPVDSNIKLIVARLKSGISVMDCRQVIVKKNREWKGDPKMEEYIRPATLFNATKFEQYLGELVLPKEDAQNGAT